tara:strand:+ start:268 stop:1140 length:873 start_codon:yes stop_codon:yes gene_type:complete
MKKFVAWGLKLHSHTHSYIHDSYCKAFSSLGWETQHFDGDTEVDVRDSIVLVSAHYEHNVPLHPSNKYITHNCERDDFDNYERLSLQVYTNGIDSVGTSGEKLNEYTVFDGETKTLYQPWATDLLPDEIDTEYVENKEKNVVWVGTISRDNVHENYSEILPFVEECHMNGLVFQSVDPWTNPVTNEEHIRLIRNAGVAPTIVGPWQNENDYIPCRIFKNISYGNIGVTNSKMSKRIFGDTILYGDGKELAEKYFDLSPKQKKRMYEESSSLVKNKHTFINRINTILEVMQ